MEMEASKVEKEMTEKNPDRKSLRSMRQSVLQQLEQFVKVRRPDQKAEKRCRHKTNMC